MEITGEENDANLDFCDFTHLVDLRIHLFQKRLSRNLAETARVDRVWFSTRMYLTDGAVCAMQMQRLLLQIQSCCRYDSNTV